MSSSVKRRGKDLRAVAKGLRALPRVAGVKVARRAAASLTGALTGSFDAGLTAYDEPRPLGSRGNQLTLRQTGRIRSLLRLVYDGSTKLRAALSTPYARYLIRYGLLPRGGDAMPGKWSRLLERDTNDVLTAEAAKL
jgi:hypothetical protein